LRGTGGCGGGGGCSATCQKKFNSHTGKVYFFNGFWFVKDDPDLTVAQSRRLSVKNDPDFLSINNKKLFLCLATQVRRSVSRVFDAEKNAAMLCL
jgi:hypothetical protein